MTQPFKLEPSAKSYVEKVAPSVAAMAGLPILSAGAPFKAGGRKMTYWLY